MTNTFINLNHLGIGSAMAAMLGTIRNTRPPELAIALSVLNSLPMLTIEDIHPIVEGLKKNLGGRTYYISRLHPAPPSGEHGSESDTGLPPIPPVAPAHPTQAQSHYLDECLHSSQKPQPM